MMTSWHRSTFHIIGPFVRGIDQSPVDQNTKVKEKPDPKIEVHMSYTKEADFQF